MSNETGVVADERELAARVARLERELAEAKAALAAKPLVDRMQLFALTDALPILVSVIGRDQRYEFANKAYESWFGPEDGRVAGRHALDVLGREAYDQLLPHFKRALGGERVSFDANVPYRAGGPRHIHAVMAPRRGPDGAINGVIALAMDLSQRFVDETALRESEARFRTLAETIREGFYLASVRDERRIAYTSPAFATIWGWPAGERPSGWHSLIRSIHPDDQATALAACHRQAEGVETEVEYRIVRPNGEARWVLDRSFPILDDDGKPSQVAGVIEDVHDRKLAEQALAAEAAERNAILSQLAEGVVIADAEGRVVFVNEAAARIHGGVKLGVQVPDYSRVYHLFTEDGRPYPSEDLPLARAVRGEIVTNARWRIRGPHAEVLAVGSAKPVFGPDGKQIGAVVTLRDETAREQAEAAVRESEARFRLIADAAPVPMWVTRLDRKREFVNRAYVDFLGISYKEAVDFDWRHVIHPDDIARIHKEQVEKEASLRPFTLEARYRDAHGRWRWLRSESQPRWGASGEHTGFIGVAYDVTIAKEAELALAAEVAQRTAERDRMWQLSQDILLIVSPDGIVRAINPAVERYGYDADELAGQHFARFVHPEDLPLTAEIVRRAITEPVSGFETRLRAADGSWRWVAWSATPGESVIFAFGRDVTADKARQAELEAAQEALRQSQKMEAVGQLTGGVAHDFNNLLTPIMGSLDMLRRRLPGDDHRAQRTVETALQATERAATLVQRLLAFARRQDLQPRAIDVAELLGGMDDLLARSLGSAIRVTLEVAPGLAPARADPNQLELAILNLSINARDAMPGGGFLSISAGEAMLDGPEADLQPGRYVRIAVSDTGIGMDADTLRRAVEPFFSTKGVGKGTGLGLSMVYGFAAQLGGALRLSSTPGAGTTVELWLPVADEPAERRDGSHEAPLPAARASTVLLVDDEDLVRMGAADMLTDLGYRVVEARSGAEALTLLDGREVEFDLLVTDYLMPGTNGAELALAVRRVRPDLPVLLVTGYTNLAEDAAADIPRLTKPFRQQDLAARVAALLAAQIAG